MPKWQRPVRHGSGVICKIMRVLWTWTHMDTDFRMTLYKINLSVHTETCVHLRPVCPKTTPHSPQIPA